jgi:hypothetical protein
MSEYDLDTLDAIIDENLWQAARDGLDDDAVADLLLRHRDGVMCDGLAEHVGFEREVATDGGFSRRSFLGAAAALAALPQTASAETPDPNTVIEGRSVTGDGTYSVTDCGSVPGGLNNVHVTADMNDGPLEVEGVHEENGWSGVRLRWSSGPIEVGTGLGPDDARDLAARLVVAADAAEGNLEGEGDL